MGAVGLTMLFFGIKWSIQSVRPKAIVQFSLGDKEQNFVFSDEGLYTFCVLGAGYINTGEFEVRLSNQASKNEIEMLENFMKPRFRKDWKIGVEYLNFRIKIPGEYKLELINPESLTAKKSMLKAKQLLKSPIPATNLEGMIKKTIPISKKLFGIIFLVLGVNMSAWGIMLGINPNLFN